MSGALPLLSLHGVDKFTFFQEQLLLPPPPPPTLPRDVSNAVTGEMGL